MTAVANRRAVTLEAIGHAKAVADTAGMPRAEWLELRRRGIGGSDAAAVCGLDPWRSPFEVWLDKTGLFVDETAGEAVRWGRCSSRSSPWSSTSRRRGALDARPPRTPVDVR